MIRILSIAAFLFCCSNYAQSEDVKIIKEVDFQSSILDTTLNSNESEYYLIINYVLQYSIPETFQYSMDGTVYNVQIGTDRTIKVKTTPGKHKFEFQLAGYTPIKTKPLKIDAQYRDSYAINFSPLPIDKQQYNVISLKPVIYLYPETEIDVEVKLKFEGENPILYPAYNNGWKCTAQPNGDLKIGDETFNYLFWEATQPDHLRTANQKEGFIVNGSEAISFLEDKLSKAGFTSKEKADFITFWGPMIQKNDLNFVRFEFNEVCDKFTELDVSPKPDNVYRLYIFFSPIDEAFEVSEQNIEPMNRNGFTVLEWGGQISLPIKTTNINL